MRPGDLFAVVDNMMEDGQDYFCVGIDHALALKVKEDPDLREAGSFSMRGHSIGGFGSVTTNKVIATIAGDVFGMDVQAYPKYGSEKKGLPTTYYLTIANKHIYLHSELEFVDLVVLNDTTALFSGNPLVGLLAGRGDRHAVVVQQPQGRVGADSGAPQEVHPREEDSRLFRRHGADRPRRGLGRRPADAHAGHRAARRVPQAHALWQATAA